MLHRRLKRSQSLVHDKLKAAVAPATTTTTTSAPATVGAPNEHKVVFIDFISRDEPEDSPSIFSLIRQQYDSQCSQLTCDPQSPFDNFRLELHHKNYDGATTADKSNNCHGKHRYLRRHRSLSSSTTTSKQLSHSSSFCVQAGGHAGDSASLSSSPSLQSSQSTVCFNIYSRCIHLGVESEQETVQRDFTRAQGDRQQNNNLFCDRVRCMVIFYRSSSVVWRMRSYLERLLLRCPMCMIIVVPIGLNVQHLERQVKDENGIFNAKGAFIQLPDSVVNTTVSSLSYHDTLSRKQLTVSQCHVNADRLMEQLIQQCDGEKQNKKFLKVRRSFLIRRFFPHTIENMRRTCNGDNIPIDGKTLERAMSQVRSSAAFKSSNSENKALIKLERELEQIMNGTVKSR